MPAEFDGWTLPSVPSDVGPSGGDLHKASGQIDFTPTWGRETWDEAGNFSQDAKGARQDVPYEHDFHQHADINFAPGRVDVPDPINDPGGVPSPYCGDTGSPLDLSTVGDRASDNDHGAGAPDGSPGGSDHLPKVLD